MDIVGEIDFVEALYDGLGLLKKTFFNVLIFLVLVSTGIFLVVSLKLYNTEYLGTAVNSIFSTFASVQLIVKIKDIVLDEKKKSSERFENTFFYALKCIAASVLIYLMFMAIFLSFYVITLFLFFIAGILAILLIIPMMLLAFVLSFVYPAIVCGDMGVLEAIGFGFRVVKEHLGQFIAIGLAAGLVNYLFRLVTSTLTPSVTMIYVIAALGLLFSVVYLHVTCVMFFQATRLHVIEKSVFDQTTEEGY